MYGNDQRGLLIRVRDRLLHLIVVIVYESYERAVLILVEMRYRHDQRA